MIKLSNVALTVTIFFSLSFILGCGMRQDVSTLVSALMTIVRTQGGGGDAASAPSTKARLQMNDQDEDEEVAGAGDGGEGAPLSREKQDKQNGRERVVLLMHETRVLTASDATRVLLLLAREVRTWLLIYSTPACAISEHFYCTVVTYLLERCDEKLQLLER